MKVSPAIERAPEREPGVVLRETAYSTFPYPLPSEPAVIVIQSDLLVAVQVQPAGDVTETVPVPAALVKDPVPGEIT